MRLLLDTHIALWFVLGNERLSAQARDLVSDPANDVFVSVVSLLEIALKNGVRESGSNAIGIDVGAAHDLFLETGLEPLTLATAHLIGFERLTREHRDPFDRLLVAQARVEQLLLVTADRALSDFGEPVLPV